jgi:hypothetical protein
VGACEAVLRLADRNRAELMEVPPRSWDEEADRFVVERYIDRSLFERLAHPLTWEGWDWIELRPTEGKWRDELRLIRAGLQNGERLAEIWIRRLARLLPENELLGQIAAWGEQPSSPEREQALAELLKQPVLDSSRTAWLERLLRTCEPLGSMPDFSAGELALLLPVLDPVRDVLREMLAREPTGEPDEELLLARLIERLEKAPVRCPPPPSEEQRTRWPRWVEQLALLPNWRPFFNCQPTPGSS